MASREVRDRYIGSFLGLLWALLQPVALLCVLIAVFGFAFGFRAGEDSNGSKHTYALLVIAGYLPWMAISGAAQAATSCIRSNAALVKQIAFPMAVLPVKVVLANMIPQLVGLVLLCCFLIFSSGGIPASALMIIPAFVLQMIVTIGISFILASLGAYFKDLDHALPTLLMINLYLLPIFYSADAAPTFIGVLIEWNPLTPFIEVYQHSLIKGDFGSFKSWTYMGALSAASLYCGFRLFRRASFGFGNLV
jgi:lipopolysaccharide transport system permease protein